ncbi:MAG: hypothetical protein H6925_01325 [Holosporaceae bacterium]|nr:MAG: hypothetical protein H6925_01325 [Holosporaceae bacterium]
MAAHSTLDLSDAGTLQFARSLVGKYEEVNWLLDRRVNATLQGEKGVPENSWSVQITREKEGNGRHCIEFERTVHSVLCLHVFNQGGDAAYSWFVQNQKTHPLTRKNFDKISALVQEVVSKYGLDLIETNLILGDLGKTPKARDLAAPHGVTEGDHDIFLAKCLEHCPDIFPTYVKLGAEQKDIIQKYAGLVHFGHLWHVEGTAIKMLSHLKETGVMKDASDFDFEYVTHICDIAAVLAHVSQNGSLILTDDAFETMEEAMETVRALAGMAPNKALQIYLNLRAKRIGLDGIQDVATRNVLARLAAMMRLRVRDDALGKELLAAWESMPNKEQVLQVLDPMSEDTTPTPTYVPAVLENMRNALSKHMAPQDTLNAAIGTALPWMVKVIEAYKEGKGTTYPDELTLNFNPIGGVVRDAPHALDTNPAFEINLDNGEVTLKT